MDAHALDRVTAAANAAEQALVERDRAIVAAYLTGASLRSIAASAGLTHPGVGKIVDRVGLTIARNNRGGLTMSVRSEEGRSAPISAGGYVYQHDDEQDRADFAEFTAGELLQLQDDRSLDFSAHPALAGPA